MRVIVVNVNTTESVSRAIHLQATRYAAPDTQIDTVTPFFGPRSVQDDFESQISAVAVIDRVAAIEGPFDAVIEAGFGENARPGLQSLLSVPVIGITDAAATTAALLGRRFSVITTVRSTVPQIEERLLVNGLGSRCCSIRATDLGVLDIEHDVRAATTEIVSQAQAAVRDDHADVICLGCAGMVGLEDSVAASVPVPVVDGVSAAVKIAESLHALQLRPQSAPPIHARELAVDRWPLHRYLHTSNAGRAQMNAGGLEGAGT
ncbi:MAG: aspartate/glutamate racemase family protein [Nocardioidaceae bacterium]